MQNPDRDFYSGKELYLFQLQTYHLTNKKLSNKKTIKRTVKTNKNLHKLNFGWLTGKDKKVKIRLKKILINIKDSAIDSTMVLINLF